MSAEVYHLTGEFDKARQEIALARTRFSGDNPAYPSALAVAAGAEIGLNNIDAAERLVDTMLVLPNDPNRIASRGVWVGEELEVHGHPVAAQRVYTKVLSWSEGRSLSLGRRALIAFRAMAPAEALAILEEHAVTAPRNQDALGQLAITLDRLGRSQEAQAKADTIASFAPASMWPALFYARRGDARAAVAHLRRAIEAGGNYGPLRSAPELLPIAADPAFQAFMRPKTLPR